MDEVDQLVDYGLERYGLGDVDGALVAWERALAIDPDETRAAAYVDYVRENYELLAGTPRASEAAVPFGLGAVPGDGTAETDEGDYEIEISAGAPPDEELKLETQSAIEKFIDRVDDGWFLDDEPAPTFQLEPPPLEAPPSRHLPLPAEEEQTSERAYSDFTDLRSAAPTQEINTPRGFIHARLVPLTARPDDTGETSGFDADDDRLRTRPGRSAGSPLELSEIPQGVAPEALAALGPRETASHGPEERTRESPFVRVTFNPDTQDLTPPPVDLAAEPPADPSDDERTQERSALRLDTMSEATSERRSFSPAPIDGGSPSGAHPPLVIIEDPVLTEFGPPGSPQPPTKPSRNKQTLEGIGSVAPPTASQRPRRASTVPAGDAPPPPPPTGAASEEIVARLEAALEATAPADESRSDRTRRRVGELIDRAIAASEAGDHAISIVALDLALAEDPESAVAQKLVHRHQPAILDCYQRFLGDLSTRPGLAMPMHELSSEKLDIRAAFLLSRIDGALTFEEILDVSGMQRSEAFRHLANLVLRGILTVR